MSNPQNNFNHYNTPRHGRISSRSGIEAISPPQGRSASGPQFRGHRPVPTVSYGRDHVPTDLQNWHGQSHVPFLRWAYAVRNSRGDAHSNYNFDPDVNVAIRVSETIDAFDQEPRLVHELILSIANPELGHDSMAWIKENRPLVEMLLYRHHQHHGGLILPPMAPAVQVMREFEIAVTNARQRGMPYEHDDFPRIKFPSWNTAAPAFSCPRDRRGPDGGFGGFGSNVGGTNTGSFWN
ncbi:hypothetical protein NX059_010741 [Plenodomus lindquistii]|nr:hypothetical protein NX059_010741 [Plenodomus lindquistii]